MAGRLDNRVSFAAGEVGADFLHQSDDAEHFRSCRRVRNAYPTTAGRARRRPGTQHLLNAAGENRIFMYRTATSHETLVFTDGQVDIYDADGASIATLSSAPWGTADLELMAVTSGEGVVYVASEAFWTQELLRASDGTWTFADLPFDTAAGGVVRQPYYRFPGARGVTMGLSGYTGSVTVTFSDDVLDAQHVGVKFRYATRVELEITAVTNATTGTATITGRVFPAVTVTVADGTKFQVGEVVESEILQSQGVIANIATNVLTIQMLDGFDTFEVVASPNEDKVIGPQGSSVVTAVSSVSTPSAISLWDEAMFSDFRGYPAEARLHKRRLLLAGFPNAKNVLAGSAINRRNDFGVRADEVAAADPFIVEIQEREAQAIKHLVSTEQLIICTNSNIYYVPESGENPITPESIDFNLIAPLESSDVTPVVTGLGVMVIQNDPSRLMLITPTGNVRASWRLIDVSYKADHLLNSPRRIAMADGFSGREQAVLVLNGDGTLVAAVPRPGDNLPGFAEWERQIGTWEDLFSNDRTTLLSVTNGEDRYLVTLTDEARIDDEMDYSAAQSARASMTQQIVNEKSVIASVALDESGENAQFPPTAGHTVGYDFAVEIQPSPPRRANVLDRHQRISRAVVDVRAGNYRIDEVLQASLQGGDDLGVPTPERARIDEENLLGWADEPVLTIGQRIGDGSELVVNSIRMVVES
jgi:hypothetical protein